MGGSTGQKPKAQSQLSEPSPFGFDLGLGQQSNSQSLLGFEGLGPSALALLADVDGGTPTPQRRSDLTWTDMMWSPSTDLNQIDLLNSHIPLHDPDTAFDGTTREMYRKHHLLSGAARSQDTAKDGKKTIDYGKEIDGVVAASQDEEHSVAYATLSEEFNIPVALIAALHYREAHNDMGKYLAQGDKVGTTPTNIPIHPKFDTWLEGARWALRAKQGLITKLGITKDTRDAGTLLTFAELYNGAGLHGRNMPSSYIYGGTDIYQGGHFPADGNFDPNAMSHQAGVLPILDALGAIDGTRLDAPADDLTHDEAFAKVIYGAHDLQEGDTGPEVDALQTELFLRKDVSGLHSGTYDDATMNAVKALQKEGGSTESGVMDNPAVVQLMEGSYFAEMLREDNPLTLRSGSDSGLGMRVVQQNLKEQKKFTGKVDGMGGPNTAKQVRKAIGSSTVTSANANKLLPKKAPAKK